MFIWRFIDLFDAIHLTRAATIQSLKKKLGENMKKNSFIVVLLIILAASFITGCTSNVGTASSWPGTTVDENLVVVSYAYQLYALDVQNGNKVWVFPVEQDSKMSFYAPVEFADGLVVVGDYTNTLYAINRETGVLVWDFDGADSNYIGSALFSNDLIYAPNADGTLYVLDKDGILQWEFKTEGPNWSKPVADEQRVYLASMDHNLYALNLNYENSELITNANGNKTLVSEPLWKTDLETSIVSNPLLADGFVYVGTIDGKMYKVNAADGSVEWSFEGGSEVRSIWTTPVILEDMLFFGTEDGFIYALDMVTGQPVWNTPITTDAQIVASGATLSDNVVFGTTAGELIIVDKDQVKSPSITREGSIYTTPIVKDGKIYLTMVSGKKLIYALDENGREYWSFSQED